MARPTKKNPTGKQKKQKQTPEVLALLDQAFSIGASNKEAIFFAGIAESTFYEWTKDDPKLSERFDLLRESPILKARQTVFDNLGDPATARWYLEKKRSAEFRSMAKFVTDDGKGNDAPLPIVNIVEAYNDQPVKRKKKTTKKKTASK